MKKAAGRTRSLQLLVPVLFMLFHQLVLNIAASRYFGGYLDTIDPARTLHDYSDPSVVAGLQAQADVQAYASLYLTLIVIPIYAAYLFYRRRQTRNMPRMAKVGGGDFVAGLSIMTGALGIVTLWMVFLALLAEQAGWLKTMLDEYRELAATIVPADRYRFIVILTLVVLVPIAEELLFRGIVQGEFGEVLPEKWAIVLTLVLFSLFHLNPIQISYVLVPAFVLSLVYALTRNLLVPIVMHMWFNFVGSGLLIGLTEDPEQAALWLFYTELIFIVIGGMSLVMLYRKRQSARAEETEALP